jgi:hypothetical protein
MSTSHRLAAPLAARLVGSVLVVVAVLVVLATLLVAVLDLHTSVLLAVALVALLAVAATAVAVRRRPVLRLDESGYRVSWVRGAGVKAAAWGDVADAVTASPGGIDCVVLRLEDGRTTSIPVAAVATDRDALVAEVRERLRRGEGLRPLDG